ncbi:MULTISPECIES: hypothetical protein [unclassified Lentimonas]|uniref:hypothetical protein n=1 Tax=unclassified Lentimonas TaxID=2630993 RepID=UPI0013270BDF|nr:MULTISPECIES: hypothetical protein [unclassified Lentimonas]CAA6677561.1 Unannotated [Lentimonas sp. CC4]CAA6684342.1 Unannotated [Lentimonas sp. CC6]CAA7078140.1 Unannotated [Lentimonas sp. CC4]CAA7168342.1 Unannotated [Lentimonas sp. CC21]CAA7181825.1 Unannotated [Lentimonas sp. CC8]
MMNKRTLAFSGVAILAASLTSQAAIIVGYDFTAGSTTASSIDANVTSSINLNAGATGFAVNATVGDSTGTTEGIPFSSDAGNFRATNGLIKAGSRDLAIGAGDYYSFTIAPNSGFELDLDKIIFSASRAADNTRSAESWALMSSITGFTTADASIDAGAITTVAGGVTPYEQISVDVSGNSAFQNITTSTEFRVYVWGGASSSSSSAINYDNIGVTGTVIPEPGTYALLAGCLALTSVMIRRRRA